MLTVGLICYFVQPNLSSALWASIKSRNPKYITMQTRVRFGQLGEAQGQFNSPHGFCLGKDLLNCCFYIIIIILLPNKKIRTGWRHSCCWYEQPPYSGPIPLKLICFLVIIKHFFFCFPCRFSTKTELLRTISAIPAKKR